MKQKLAKVLLAVTFLISSLLFAGCDSLLSGLTGGLLGKQVPVYQGMSISAPTVQTATAMSASTHTRGDIILLGVENGNKDNNGKHNGWYKGDYADKDENIDEENPFPDNSENENIENEIKDNLEVVGAKDKIYYANVGEDIYINIHISNPDDFEIQSFTLNGTKYANYMFEKGSTMETIILKYNVGAESGVKEYTIDAIKYIDGTEIKDVKIGGEKTVRAGVRKDNQVMASVTNVTVDFNEISFNASLTDEDGLIAYSQGSLKAVLYDGETLVATKDLTVGENEISFNGLKTNGLYQYAIVGYYDNLKDGFGLNVLYKETLYTKAIVLFDDVTVTKDGIEFSLAWADDYANENLTSLKLYQGDTLVKDLSATANSVNGLQATKEYKLVGVYQNGSVMEEITLTFIVPVKTIPTVTLELGEVGSNTVAFAIAEIDEDNAGQIAKIELTAEDGTLIQVSDLTAREITDLKSNTKYELKITYEYDAGEGNNSFVLTETFYTALGDTSVVYERIGDEYVVKGLANKTVAKVVIEDTIAGVPVTKIAQNAFSGCANLTDLVMGKNISEIGSHAFYNCTKLTNVYISDLKAWCEIPFEENLRSIDNPEDLEYTSPLLNGNANLYLNDVLLVDLVIPDTVTEISKVAFYGCQSIEKVEIPDSVDTVGLCAFIACANLTEVTIGESGNFRGNCSIRDYAFALCGKLGKVALNSVATVGKWGFCGCTNVTQLTLSDNLLSLSDQAFMGFSVAEFKLPSSVQHIGENVFAGWSKLETLVIPDTLTQIYDGMFYSCTGLKNVVIPNSVISIGNNAFYCCTSLTNITIPDSVTSIGYQAFSSCSSLTSVEIGDSVTSIGEQAFSYCDSLTSIVIPNSVISMGDYVFAGCSNLTIYCEVESQPNNWSSYWDISWYLGSDYLPVVWGYKTEE